MLKKKYSAEYKTKIVLSILDGSKEFNEICSENNLSPNMVRKWKQDFLANAPMAFASDAERKSAQRKEADLRMILSRTVDKFLTRDRTFKCLRQ